ncbi:CaiB/BaiF CoA transferase family protein [Segeticoccus rhizosphaerae]|uniref:CaiB/BaiF CoA transferase family protein n=1 Tax=Segeticoccus rhizosphaerae TaxID=1104777 RepID=UPI00126428C3|nr:CoA transferase [Segeticoccus rhizosphaerae]
MSETHDAAELLPGPLHGIRVLDLSRLVAGNQLTLLLADFGADVIKVERPGTGDTLRHWLEDGKELFWKVYGRNKRSITLDLKHAEGRDAVLRLVVGAHVLVESFRPGALERLGLSPEELLEANPALVVARVSGWGQTGSMSDQPGFGTLIEAMSGLAAWNGFPDREPVLPPGALADMVAGTFGAFSVLAALRHAETTGRGQVIDLSLFEPLFSVLGPMAAIYRHAGRVPQRNGSRSQSSAPRNVYRTGDGEWIALSGSTQTMTERLFAAIGRVELVQDPRFVDNGARLAHVEELDAILGGFFGQRSLEASLRLMRAAGVTAAPVMDIAGLLDTEFFRTRGVVVDGPDVEDDIPVAMHQVVPRLSASPGAIRTPAPRLGQDTDDVLREVFSTDELEVLREKGACG